MVSQQWMPIVSQIANYHDSKRQTHCRTLAREEHDTLNLGGLLEFEVPLTLKTCGNLATEYQTPGKGWR